MGNNSSVSYWLQSSDPAAGSWDGSYDDMKTLLNSMSSENLKNAEGSYRKAAEMLRDSAEEILQRGYELQQHWQGEDANRMQEQLRDLWQTCRNLESAAGMLAQNLFHNQAQGIDWAKAHPPEERSTSGWQIAGSVLSAPVAAYTAYDHVRDGNQNDEDARNFINIGGQTDGGRSLGDWTLGDHQATPQKVDTRLPNPNTGGSEDDGNGRPPGIPGGGHPSGIPGGGPKPSGIPDDGSLAGMPGGGSDLGGSGGPGGIPGGGSPSGIPGGGAGGTDLSGLPGGGPGGIPGGGGGLGGLPGGGGGAPGGIPGSGVGGGGLPGGVPGGMGAGRAGGGLSAAEQAAARAAKGRGAGVSPMGGPMGAGGGQGGQEEERERTTWLTEDEDVWRGDDDATPPVIG